jgi:hypothetical protein
MNDNEIELPDLLWSCFINWINTIERALKSDSGQNKTLKEHLGLN